MKRAAEPHPVLRLTEPYAIALSGGGDSVELLRRASQGDYGSPPTAALIVDHALRAGSERDAQTAADIARQLGVPSYTLTWRRNQESPRSQNAARAARHRLLATACAELAIGRLLLGHTADDQAETVVMRLARPSVTARALAGLWPASPSPVWPEGRDLTLIRPLLNERRAAVRANLQSAGLIWVDDPANQDATFERIRARQLVQRLSEESFQAVIDCTRHAARLESAVCAAAAECLRDVVLGADGQLTVPRRALIGRPTPVQTTALDALIDAASGHPQLRDRAALRRAIRVSVVNGGTATLGGALLRVEKDLVVVSRDPGAVSGRADVQGLKAESISTGKTRVWDGRYLVGPATQQAVITAGDNGAPRVHTREGLPCKIELRSLADLLLRRRLHAQTGIEARNHGAGNLANAP